MKSGFVLDCSVTMTWCFAEESAYGVAALAHLGSVPAEAPTIWPLEVANVLLMSERKGRITMAGAKRFIELLESLPISVEREASSPRAWHEILSLGKDLGLTSYDAAYLDLALRLDLPLATLDERLRKSAKGAGVALLKLG